MATALIRFTDAFTGIAGIIFVAKSGNRAA
jgi:hypothetical protein